MKMKKIILLCMLALIISCSKPPYYDIPLDANGKAYLTDISSTTSDGLTTLDAGFSLTATLPNANVGDVMKVELLRLQEPQGGGAPQLLPMAGTQTDITVTASKEATVNYTREKAMLSKAGDYVTVVFNGATEYAKGKVTMEAATVVSKPQIQTKTVDITRTAEVAYFNVTVEPIEAAYTGNLVVKRKNGVHDSWVDVTGTPFSGAQPFLVPISGDEFAVGKDTMYYSFTSARLTYTEVINATVIVRDPYFYLKKSSVTMTLNTSSDARNILVNAAASDAAPVASNAVAVILGLSASSGSLMLRGGSGWLAASPNNLIEFVETNATVYSANKATNSIALFDAAKLAGQAKTEANPVGGAGYYIFRATNGTGPEDVYYGMIKSISATPTSSTIEYRIGNQYAHLLVIK
jgi:hypothetical protein